MKYLIFCLLFCLCGFSHADSKEAIQSRAEWVESEYQKGAMSEGDAIAEVQDLKRRAVALEIPRPIVVARPPAPVTPKVAEIAGSSLLRQATLPGPAGWSIFQFFGGISWWILLFWGVVGGGILLFLCIVYLPIDLAGQAATSAQGIGSRTPRPYNPERDGISLAAAMGTVPVRTPQATQPVQSPRQSNKRLHSGEVPDNLI